MPQALYGMHSRSGLGSTVNAATQVAVTACQDKAIIVQVTLVAGISRLWYYGTSMH